MPMETSESPMAINDRIIYNLLISCGIEWTSSPRRSNPGWVPCFVDRLLPGATGPGKEVTKMNLNDFDHAGIAADHAVQQASTPYERSMAESQRSLALGMQLLQNQIDRMELRINLK